MTLKRKQKLIMFLGFVFCVFISMKINAQLNSPNPSIPAPAIASQMHAIDVSNDLFNGKAQVNIPIYKYDWEGISVPIDITYVGGNGIKPDELPSWVGSGWKLSGGGFINRTVKGRPDEIRDFTTVVFNPYYNPNGIYTYKETWINTTDFSYFANYNLLTVPNWSTGSYATSLINGSNATYSVNYQNEVRTFYNHHPQYDLVPDEFSFVAGNISGKFYKNHLGNWVLSSNDGKKYAVDVYTGEQTVAEFYVPQTNNWVVVKVPRLIKYITLTSSDGIKYYFGNTNVNAALEDQYFDYSHSSTYSDNSWPMNFNGLLWTDIVPNTWHLTKIENLKTNSQILFEYNQVGLQSSKMKQAWGVGNTLIPNSQIVYQNGQIFYPNPENPTLYYRLTPLSKVVYRNWNLSKITFPNSATIEFSSSVSSQLSSNESPAYDQGSSFLEYFDIYHLPNIWTMTNSFMQLDNILIKYNSEIKKKVVFNYINSVSNRLQLESISEASSGNLINSKMQFEYNTNTQLPLYGVAKNDHWGYYNNKDFFTSVAPPYEDFSKLSTYSSYREPDVNYSGAEMLSKIIYPTKGSVWFTYEPNDYSKKKVGINSITNIGSNVIGGGVRIKKVSYYNENNALQSEKNYEYRIPGSGSLSSGVLGIPPKQYLKGTSTDYSFRVEGNNPVYYEGNCVTYTFASEVISGHGLTRYEYTNYDNGFNDESPIENNVNSCGSAAFCDAMVFSYDYSNKSFKRGKLISRKILNESGSIVNESTYNYIHDNSEFDKEEIRSIYLKTNPIGANYYSTVLDKVYSDLLFKKEEKEFSNTTLTQTSTSTYDIYGNLKESKSIDSKGNVFRKRYKYAYEYPTTGTDQISLGINKLIQKSCKNALVEEIETREDANGSNVVVLSGAIYTYGIYTAFLEKMYKLQISNPIPFSSFVQSIIQFGNFVKDANYPQQSEVSYDLYDLNGNVLQKTSRAGVIETQIWGYNNTYPVATIIGIDYATASSYVSTTASQAIIQNPANDQQLADELNNIRTGLANTNAQVTTVTYSPLIGLTRKIDPNNHTTYYEYDGFARIARILDENRNIIKAYEYHFKN